MVLYTLRDRSGSVIIHTDSSRCWLRGFSHSPTDGSFTPLASQPSTFPKCLTLQFLSCWAGEWLQQHIISRAKLTCLQPGQTWLSFLISVNDPTFGELYFITTGRVNIKRRVRLNAWPPHTSFPCGNLTAALVHIHFENQDQVHYYLKLFYKKKKYPG